MKYDRNAHQLNHFADIPGFNPSCINPALQQLGILVQKNVGYRRMLAIVGMLLRHLLK
jgi:hypothetical protein